MFLDYFFEPLFYPFFKNHVGHAQFRIRRVQQRGKLSSWFGQWNGLVCGAGTWFVLFRLVNERTQLLRQFPMPEPCLVGGHLHGNGIEMSLVPFDMGLYQCFQLLGTGHICLKISIRIDYTVCSTTRLTNKSQFCAFSKKVVPFIDIYSDSRDIFLTLHLWQVCK